MRSVRTAGIAGGVVVASLAAIAAVLAASLECILAAPTASAP